jgi:hypothetical protein
MLIPNPKTVYAGEKRLLERQQLPSGGLFKVYTKSFIRNS